MNNNELVSLLNSLRREPSEISWIEFKHNGIDPQEIGEYISALSNAACLAGMLKGYLIFGIQDGTHNVVGTHFNPNTEKGRGNQSLMIWLTLGLTPRINVRQYKINHPDGQVVLFEIGSANGRPVSFYGKEMIREGSSKTLLKNYPEKERAIWVSGVDWSSHISSMASIDDLDHDAIQKARDQFKMKNPSLVDKIDEWSNATFLDKARLTIRGAITNAAIVLLGKPESASLLAPALAKISWILKNTENQELDYEHFGSPFMLNVDSILSRIRNLTLRTLPSGTMFPQEITQYDVWVLREALHNCIAHQDYMLQGRINIVETPNTVLLTNAGSFLPGSIEEVIRRDSPSIVYRNPFLAEAMVNLNMIDTQGGGIKRMFVTQARRFFPLPDYDLTDPSQVSVTLRGEILDEHYTKLLMERTDLDLEKIILLDKVQKRVRISREDRRVLRNSGLVEGRYPNLHVTSNFARLTGQEARHIRDRGLEKKYYLDLIEELVREHGPIDRQKINELLLNKLPEVLTDEQKNNRIHNMLSELSRKKRIRNSGSRRCSEWCICDNDSSS